MNKTGLKTFVCSFVITLSAIICADRAFFYTPHMTEDDVKIPRKNIALFFSHNYSHVASLQVEPVQKSALEPAAPEIQEVKIAQNIPDVLPDMLIKENSVFENDEIPLQLVAAETQLPAESQKAEDAKIIENVPLIYAGIEKNKIPVVSAKPEDKITEEPQMAEQQPENAPVLLAAAENVPQAEDIFNKPLTIKGTRQIIKIDNLKKRQEKLAAAENQSQPDNAMEIPLQNSVTVAAAEAEKNIKPEANQVASLTENIVPSNAEKASIPVKENERHWQTMAERRQDENPWVVARGSKFVKNKKILEEDFASAEAVAKVKKTSDGKSVKVAVQDNILIPIPRELLENDNLVPNLGNDKNASSAKKPAKTVKKEEGSLFDSIASVFSKENREKAIKNLKEKSGKLIKDDKNPDNVRPQILPTEIRLSFQPNRAEISGQTLRWIQAFAKKSVDEDNVGLEIRIDGSGAFALQQKRLNLLYNILTANAVDYQKINTVFVEREPNSFVVRTVKITGGAEHKKENDGWKKYYQQW